MLQRIKPLAALMKTRKQIYDGADGTGPVFDEDHVRDDQDVIYGDE